MSSENVTLGLAFIAGFISFVSPCVLPLVPAYIGYMGGRVTNTIAAQIAVSGSGQASVQRRSSARFTSVLHSLFFVAGFTFVFVTIGILSAAFVQQASDVIGRIGGILIIIFGLHFMGLLSRFFKRLESDERILSRPLFSLIVALAGVSLILWGFTGTLLPHLTTTIQTTAGVQSRVHWPTIVALVIVSVYLLWLTLGGAFTHSQGFWSTLIQRIQTTFYTDTRRQMVAQGGQGLGGSAVMGVIFAAGWTPCIGPVYGAVLTLAASTNAGDISRAIPLLAAYSIGLGVPFVLTALLLDSAKGFLRRLQRRMHMIELASGAFLVLIGILVASGRLQVLSQSFSVGEFAEAAINLETSVINSLNGAPEQVDIEPTPLSGTPTGNPGLNSIVGAAEEIRAPISGIEIGNIAPDFQTVLDTGQSIRLTEFRGQVVILNFWATWCGPCRVEMREFENAYQRYSDKGFTIVAVNNKETLEDVKDFREELGLTFPLALDELGNIQDLFGVFSYPSTFVLNHDGIIIARHYGPLTVAEIQMLVNQALT